MSNETIMRYNIADYLEIGADTYELMGAGFNTLDESPTAQIDSKTYINDKSQSSQIKGYQTKFAFDTDLILSEKAIMELYEIGRNQKTGADAERGYIRVELFRPLEDEANTFVARKFRTAVEVASVAGAGGEAIKVTGNLNGVGSFVEGTFNTTTKLFTPEV